MARSVVLIMTLIILINGRAQITVDALPQVVFCPGTALLVGFTATGNYGPGNQFTVEISDAYGSFAVPTVIGNLVSTTSGSALCVMPSTLGSGFRLRVISSSPASIGDVSAEELTIYVPNAGLNSVLTVCSNAGPFDLLEQMNADLGGSWSGPLGAFSGIFDPAVDPAGIYTYSVSGPPPCPGASSSLVITVTVAPAAGTSTNTSVCLEGPPVLLYSLLGGSPSPGGFWTSPDNMASPGIFVPGTSPPGCYIYVVQGTAPCMNGSSTICIAVLEEANAGTDTSISWCQSDGGVDLFQQLAGDPLPGGTWTDPNATGALAGSWVDISMLNNGSYTFTYTVQDPPCADGQATLTVVLAGCFTTPDFGYPVE